MLCVLLPLPNLLDWTILAPSLEVGHLENVHYWPGRQYFGGFPGMKFCDNLERIAQNPCEEFRVVDAHRQLKLGRSIIPTALSHSYALHSPRLSSMRSYSTLNSVARGTMESLNLNTFTQSTGGTCRPVLDCKPLQCPFDAQHVMPLNTYSLSHRRLEAAPWLGLEGWLDRIGHQSILMRIFKVVLNLARSWDCILGLVEVVHKFLPSCRTARFGVFTSKCEL